MTIGAVTYSTLTDSVATYLKNTCVNLNGTKFDGLSVYLKSGYSYTKANKNPGSKVASLKQGFYTGHAYERIDANTAIPDYRNTTKADIITAMKNSYVPTSKYPDDENITVPKFIAYFNNVCAYCMKNVGFVSSSYIADTYLVYRPGYFDTDVKTYDNSVDDLIRILPVNDTVTNKGMIQLLKQNLSSSLRHKPCKYTYTFD